MVNLVDKNFRFMSSCENSEWIELLSSEALFYQCGYPAVQK